MSVFDLSQFRAQLALERKWLRAIEVIDQVKSMRAEDTLIEDVVLSQGDSLTWMATSGATQSCPQMIRTARYITVLYCEEGSVEAHLGSDPFKVVEPYDDLRDREVVEARSRIVRLRDGQLLIPARGDGLAYQFSPDFFGLIMRVSVEDTAVTRQGCGS